MTSPERPSHSDPSVAGALATTTAPSAGTDVVGGAAVAGSPVRLRVARMVDDGVVELTGLVALRELETREPPGVGEMVWVDLTEPDAATVEAVAARLGLHPLIAEDIVEGNQRSKIEVTEGLVHLVLFSLAFHEERIRALEVDLILGDGFLLSVHPEDWDPRGGHMFRSGVEHVLRKGPDHVLWALVDSIVDAYFPFADRLEDTIDALQDQVVERTDRRILVEVFRLKRELIAVRRAVSPVREILNQLSNRDLALIDPEEVLYFRDIYDHVIRLADELDTDRELVAATLEVYLSQVNNNLSLIMKRLTGVTVLLAGIGAFAGIFGMSEAGAAFAGAEARGFWLVTFGTIGLWGLIAFGLRRVGWI